MAQGIVMPWLEPVLAGAGVLIADQLSKRFVLARARPAAPTPRSFLAIHCIVNKRGAVLPLARLSLRVAAFALCGAVAILALKQESMLHGTMGAAGIGLALGGIAGNFIDLIRRDGIVDFIAVGPLPIFNLADAAIVGGLALALWNLV
jgi:signal peptidase II